MRNLYLAVLGAVASTLSCVALASEPVSPAQRHGAHACSPEVEQFCKGVRPGNGRIAACMKKHESRFSVACKTAIENSETRRRQRLVNSAAARQRQAPGG